MEPGQRASRHVKNDDDDGLSSPLCHLPASSLYQEQSALRSTLHSANQQPPPPAAVALPQDDIMSRYRPLPAPTTTFTPINERNLLLRALVATDSTSFTQRYGRHISQLSINMYEINEQQLHQIDKSDDTPYHLGHKGGDAYSGTFPDCHPLKLDTQALIDQKLDERYQAVRVAGGPQAARHVRALLTRGASLHVEQTLPHDSWKAGLECRLPACLSRSECIPAGTYYLALWPGLEQAEYAEDLFFCLKCMEWLWTGRYTGQPLPHPGIVPGRESDFDFDTIGAENISATPFSRDRSEGSWEDDFGGLQLDGAGDRLSWPPVLSRRNLYTSKGTAAQPGDWKQVGHDFIPPRTPGQKERSFLATSRHASQTGCPRTQESQLTPQQGEDLPDSPDSTASNGEWRHPPTRFQHIAAFVQPGASLEEKIVAAIRLWKAASREQLRWNLHLHRAQINRDYYSGVGCSQKTRRDNTAEEFKTEEEDYEDADVAL